MALNDPKTWSVRAEKDVQKNTIDWGTVAADITTGIEAIRDDRATRKGAIDEATSKMMAELAKGENINNATLSTALIDGGQSATEALQIQVDLMKKGLIKPKDYKIFLQKQQNAYTNLKGVISNWDAWETKSRERLATDPKTNLQIASQLEQDFNISTSAFGNMENVKFIPTTTGGMEAVRLIEEPPGSGNFVMPDRKKNPDNFMNPNSVGTRQNFQLNTVNVNAGMTDYSAGLGTLILEEKLSGSGSRIFKTMEDIRLHPDYDGTKQDAIDSFITNDIAKANVLGTMRAANGKGYRFAGSEEQKNKMMEEGVDAANIIMYTSENGNPVFGPDAFSAVDQDIVDFLGGQFDSKLAQKTELEGGIDPIQPKAKSTADAVLEKEQKELGTNIRNLNNILTSDDPDDVQGNLETLIEQYNQKLAAKGKQPGRKIIGYTLNDDIIQFKYADKTNSNAINRQGGGADGDILTLEDNETVGINNQIYQLGVALDGQMFNNQIVVDDWISQNKFETGGQRGISTEQAEELLLVPDQRKLIIESWKGENGMSSVPTEQELIDHAQVMNQDSLDVSYSMDDYDYDNKSTDVGTMTEITVRGDQQKTVASGVGGDEIKAKELETAMFRNINAMLTPQFQKDLKAVGGGIEVKQTRGKSSEGVDNQGANQVQYEIVFKDATGAEQIFKINDANVLKYTGVNRLIDLSFNQLFVMIKDEFVDKIAKPWGKTYRATKRGSTGQIGKKKKPLPGTN